MEKPEVSKVFLYSIMCGMLITGTANTLVGKYVDIQVAPADSGIEGRCFYFTHPYLQTTVMFAGELLCFVFLAVKIQLDKRAARQLEIMSPGANLAKQIKQKTNINPLLLAIPASCDVCGTSLMFVALTMVPASVY
jgi:hypothetical protein